MEELPGYQIFQGKMINSNGVLICRWCIRCGCLVLEVDAHNNWHNGLDHETAWYCSTCKMNNSARDVNCGICGKHRT